MIPLIVYDYLGAHPRMHCEGLRKHLSPDLQNHRHMKVED